MKLSKVNKQDKQGKIVKLSFHIMMDGVTCNALQYDRKLLELDVFKRSQTAKSNVAIWKLRRF